MAMKGLHLRGKVEVVVVVEEQEAIIMQPLLLLPPLRRHLNDPGLLV